MLPEARRSIFPDWPWLCDDSSPVTTKKGSAHSDGHKITGNSIAGLTFAGGELPV